MLRFRRHSNPELFNQLWEAGVTGAALALFCLWQPGELPVCPFRYLTGYLCPLCGMTHGLCAVGHGEWRRAVSCHLFSPLVFVGLAGLFASSMAGLMGWRWRVGSAWLERGFHVLLLLLTAHWLWRLAGLPLP